MKELVAMLLSIVPALAVAEIISNTVPGSSKEFVLKVVPMFSDAAPDMHYAPQGLANKASNLCPAGFDIKEQSVRKMDGKSVLIWKISCSEDDLITPPAKPVATAPAESASRPPAQ